MLSMRRVERTLFFIYTKNDDDLVSPNTNQLLDRPNTSARELREQDHSLDVVVFKLHSSHV